MATTGYRHGIYTSEQATSILPARTVDSAVIELSATKQD